MMTHQSMSSFQHWHLSIDHSNRRWTTGRRRQCSAPPRSIHSYQLKSTAEQSTIHIEYVKLLDREIQTDHPNLSFPFQTILDHFGKYIVQWWHRFEGRLLCSLCCCFLEHVASGELGSQNPSAPWPQRIDKVGTWHKYFKYLCVWKTRRKDLVRAQFKLKVYFTVTYLISFRSHKKANAMPNHHIWHNHTIL